MKTAIKLAKSLDFENVLELFDYLIESHVNGNFSQCKELFFEMYAADQECFMNYLNGEVRNNGLDNSIREFYIEVQESVKKYKVYKIGRKHGMSGRRQLLGKNLSREEAKRMVNKYPDSSRSMVIFTEQ